MITVVATAIAALFFHAIATPPGVPTGQGFQLEGFVLPTNCIAIMDGCTPTTAKAPTFMPETDKYRPSVLASFIAQNDGECRAAELEQVDGQPAVIPALGGHAETKQGERAFLEVVLYDAEERIQGGADGTQPYRFAIVCQAEDGTVTWSTFYGIDTKET